MKRQILTFTVLASVAIGGAVSQVMAISYYTNDGGRYTCDGGDIACGDAIGNQPAWECAEDIGATDKIVDPTVLENDEFFF